VRSEEAGRVEEGGERGETASKVDGEGESEREEEGEGESESLWGKPNEV